MTSVFCTSAQRQQSPCPKTGDQFGLSFWACEWPLLDEKILVERTHNKREVTGRQSRTEVTVLEVTSVGHPDSQNH